MKSTKPILIYEYGQLIVGESYLVEEKTNSYRIFNQSHFDALANYLTRTKCGFFSLLSKRVCFNQFVGVIKIGDLTIEVLPKTDKHVLREAEWQKVLIEMLLISMQVKAKTTTQASITIRQHSVLETYLQQFLYEAERLIHQGLIKKYRTNISNQTALKGKLLIHQQITKNAIHAEQFYVAHSIYDRDNIYNFILQAALECIAKVGSNSIGKDAQALRLFFPECKPKVIDEKLFQRLTYDRKSNGYKKAIELARIILLNYHPDIRGGKNDILAIMFDMNYLWESFIYWSLKRAAKDNAIVKAQAKELFWRHQDNWNLRLKPDLVIEINKKEIKKNLVLDTKWKFQSSVSIQDVRQLYTYLHYFKSTDGYLLYPEKLEEAVIIEKGDFYIPKDSDIKKSTHSCGLIFADLITEIDGKRMLNKDIGTYILQKFSED
ncbi:MAG: McrC family protein [Candidatus Cyclobacteriaceae bacterium M2_1C_046]